MGKTYQQLPQDAANTNQENSHHVFQKKKKFLIRGKRTNKHLDRCLRTKDIAQIEEFDEYSL